MQKKDLITKEDLKKAFSSVEGSSPDKNESVSGGGKPKSGKGGLFYKGFIVLGVIFFVTFSSFGRFFFFVFLLLLFFGFCLVYTLRKLLLLERLFCGSLLLFLLFCFLHR